MTNLEGLRNSEIRSQFNSANQIISDLRNLPNLRKKVSDYSSVVLLLNTKSLEHGKAARIYGP